MDDLCYSRFYAVCTTGEAELFPAPSENAVYYSCSGPFEAVRGSAGTGHCSVVGSPMVVEAGVFYKWEWSPTSVTCE